MGLTETQSGNIFLEEGPKGFKTHKLIQTKWASRLQFLKQLLLIKAHFTGNLPPLSPTKSTVAPALCRSFTGESVETYFPSILFSINLKGWPFSKTKDMALDKTVDAQSKWEFICDLEVKYGSKEKADIVYLALNVDKELQPDKVKRKISVSDGNLSVHFEAIEARFLRASFSAFVDVLILATKTMEEFGQGMDML